MSGGLWSVAWSVRTVQHVDRFASISSSDTDALFLKLDIPLGLPLFDLGLGRDDPFPR
jgi:predicted RNase H-like nuclease